MDLNIYLVEWWAKERLGELQAAMLRERIAEAVRAAAHRSRRAGTGTDQPGAAPAGKRRGRRSAGGGHVRRLVTAKVWSRRTHRGSPRSPDYFFTKPFSRSLARACRLRFDPGP